MNAYDRHEERIRPFLARDAAAHPGYVRLVLRWDDGAARARIACRRFASLCRDEDASRGLIVAESFPATDADFEKAFETAAAAVRPGFKLAVVARGTASRRIAKSAASIAARRRATTRLFSSEHHAAGWLMS